VAASELEPESCGLSHSLALAGWPLSESHSVWPGRRLSLTGSHWQAASRWESPGPGGPGLGFEFELDRDCHVTKTVTVEASESESLAGRTRTGPDGLLVLAPVTLTGVIKLNKCVTSSCQLLELEAQWHVHLD
jgi:hypothetical protein